MTSPDSFLVRLVIASAVVCGAIAAASADIPSDTIAQENPPSPFFEREIPSLPTKDIEIAYQSASSGGNVTQVDLWVTTDRGATWTKYASDRSESGLSRRGKPTKRVSAVGSSITYHADGEGLYGFYLVLHNAAGASSPPPTPGTAPQQWVRVDLSAPIAKILSVRSAEDFAERREVTIRWEVLDDNLTERPVTVYARTEQSKMYRPIAELRAAASEFRWEVPRDVAGRVEIKIAATDRAGHSARAIFSDLHVVAPPVTAPEEAGIQTAESTSGRREAASTNDADSLFVGPTMNQGAGLTAHGEPDAGMQRVDPVVTEDARKQYELGTWHRLRGETDVAIVRYRKALEYDPGLASARHDLAALLLLVGQTREAEDELDRLLKDRPDDAAALKTMALVQSRHRNYRSAAATLQKLLFLTPDDADAWLSFGDVTLFMGDRTQARAAWSKVETSQTATQEQRRKAAKRLELYRDSAVAAQLESTP